MKRSRAANVVAVVLACASISVAAPNEVPHRSVEVKLDDVAARSDQRADRPHTVAEFETGIVALPNAPISPASRGGDTPFFGKLGKGDATIQMGMHLLYRGARTWAIGAGALFGPSPTSDSSYGLRGLRRTHSRSYMTLGIEARHIPIHFKTFEGWVGLRGGAIIIADRFVTDDGDRVPTILGTKEVTIRTEGFTLGVQVGASWLFSDRWVAGFALRADRWLLPSTAMCSPIGDCATLTGAVEAIEAGLTLGYRIPL